MIVAWTINSLILFYLCGLQRVGRFCDVASHQVLQTLDISPELKSVLSSQNYNTSPW